jgi:hypothetical protein
MYKFQYIKIKRLDAKYTMMDGGICLKKPMQKSWYRCQHRNHTRQSLGYWSNKRFWYR